MAGSPKIPYKRWQNAISYLVDLAPNKELPGFGLTRHPILGRDEAAEILEQLRLALGLDRERYYYRLHVAWVRVRDERGPTWDEDDCP